MLNLVSYSCNLPVADHFDGAVVNDLASFELHIFGGFPLLVVPHERLLREGLLGEEAESEEESHAYAELSLEKLAVGEDFNNFHI